MSSADRIEKQLTLKAPRSRVWKALTDYEAFGQWFGVKMHAPFTPGARVTGKILIPEYEHVPFEITIERLEPESYFSWRWHPYDVDPSKDISAEPTTLVEFTLEESGGGTLLKIVESGFEGVPLTRRMEAYRANEQGWEEQSGNIARYVEQAG